MDFSGDAAFLWSAMLDSTVNTCSASVRDAFLDELHTISTLSGLESGGVFLRSCADWRSVLRWLGIWNLLHELRFAGSLHDEG